MKSRNIVALTGMLLLLGMWCWGCMRFTERDYELQKKAYDRQQAERERELQDRPVLRW